MQPFLLHPIYKDYLWGGERLARSYHKENAPTPLAETWELSVHPDGESVVVSGEHQGVGLAGLVRRFPHAMGRAYAPAKPFPMLLKLIDAQQNLSVQVHPDDEFAAREEHGLGKTELWYILACEPGAFLYLGFDRALSPEEFRERIENQTLTEVLRRVPVSPGEAYFIRAGTVHAIGAGILLAEIQQNSNTTYRVYDFGRVGADGKPRELHIEKAQRVAALFPADGAAPGSMPPRVVEGGVYTRLARCPYFTADTLVLDGSYRLAGDGESFTSVLCASGEARLHCGDTLLRLRQGDCAFVPADCGGAVLTGRAELMLCSLS